MRYSREHWKLSADCLGNVALAVAGRQPGHAALGTLLAFGLAALGLPHALVLAARPAFPPPRRKRSRVAITRPAVNAAFTDHLLNRSPMAPHSDGEKSVIPQLAGALGEVLVDAGFVAA
jgi:hypothetical protein